MQEKKDELVVKSEEITGTVASRVYPHRLPKYKQKPTTVHDNKNGGSFYYGKNELKRKKRLALKKN